MFTHDLRWLCSILVSLSLAAAAPGESSIAITSDIAGGEIQGTFSPGEVVPITLSVQGMQGNPVLGMSLELACATDAIRIQNVTVNPAFAITLGRGDSLRLPGPVFRTVRVQSPRQTDRDLGVTSPAWLARVDLEIVSPTAFESALSVRAQGAALGASASKTSVLGQTSPGNAAASTGRIVIRNAPPAPAASEGTAPASDAAAEDEADWTQEQSTVVFEVQPLGGGAPLTELAPHTTYELHYTTPLAQVNSYILTVSGPTVGAGLSSVVVAPSGPWATPERFEHLDCEYSEGPWDAAMVPGYYVLDVAEGIWITTDGCAGSQGHLCDFTTREPGPLRFDLFMDSIDRTALYYAWMRSHGDYVVQETSLTE